MLVGQAVEQFFGHERIIGGDNGLNLGTLESCAEVFNIRQGDGFGGGFRDYTCEETAVRCFHHLGLKFRADGSTWVDNMGDQGTAVAAVSSGQVGPKFDPFAKKGVATAVP